MSLIKCPGVRVVILVTSALSACSSADNRPDEEPYVADLSRDDDVICRRYREVGSHIPVRVCRTRAEMRAAREEAMRSVGPLRSMGGSGAPGSGDDPIGPPR